MQCEDSPFSSCLACRVWFLRTVLRDAHSLPLQLLTRFHLPREKFAFAAVRPSSILIEQLAVCVSKGEPVLLVGETGTGKTSTVQYLAHITGNSWRGCTLP